MSRAALDFAKRYCHWHLLAAARTLFRPRIYTLLHTNQWRESRRLKFELVEF